MITTRTRRIATTGGSGAATGSTTFTFDTPVLLVAAALDFTSQPNTTDVTLVADGVTYTLTTNTGTDVAVQPRVQAISSNGSALTGIYDKIVLSGTVTVAVAQGDAADPAVAVTLYVST